jgi:hypothetical protein
VRQPSSPQAAHEQQWRAWQREQAAAVKLQATARGWLCRKEHLKVIKARRASMLRPPTPPTFAWLRSGLGEALCQAVASGEADVHARDRQGNTLVMASIVVYDMNSLQTLLYYGADVNAQNYEGKSALHLCMEMGYEDLADWLKQSYQADDSLLDAQGRSCYYYSL